MLLLDLASRVIGLMAVVAILFGTIERLYMPAILRKISHGAAFGLAAIVCILFPTTLPDGTLLNGRSFFIAFSAAFGGLLPFIVAFWATTLAHSFLQDLTPLQIIQPALFAGAIGLIWRWTLGRKYGRSIPSLLALGFCVSLISLLLLFLSAGNGVDAFLHTYPLSLPVSLIGALILGTLIEREVRHFADAEQWRSEAFTDALTKLPNRRAFQADYQGAIRNGDPFSLIIIDIDHFKKINDVHGHPIGDLVLQALGSMLATSLPLNVNAYRLGGEEFAALIPGSGISDAVRLAEQIRVRIENARFEAYPPISISGGVAIFEQGVEGKEVLAAADAALYYAKSSGRNCVKSWNDVARDQNDAVASNSIEDADRSAI